MKRIIVLLIVISSYLFSSFLIVNSSSITEDGIDGQIILNPFSIDFQNLEVSTSNSFIEIPIYVKSDTTERITLSIDILPLRQLDEKIALSLSYRGRSIQNNVPFTLLNSGEGGRDGITIVGKIKVTIPTISTDQTYGDYSANLEMELSSNKYINVSKAPLSISATIPLVAVAGFDRVSSYTEGKKFIGATLNYGKFNFNQKNSIEKELFIKSNSSQMFRMTFNTTELIHKPPYTEYKIPMNYYYNNKLFSNNKTFIALNGKSKGESSVGTIRFETDTITGSLIAGEYEATIGVTITLE